MSMLFAINGLPVTPEQFSTYYSAQERIKTLVGDDKTYAEHDLAGYMNDIQAQHLLNIEEAEAVKLATEEAQRMKAGDCSADASK